MSIESEIQALKKGQVSLGNSDPKALLQQISQAGQLGSDSELIRQANVEFILLLYEIGRHQIRKFHKDEPWDLINRVWAECVRRTTEIVKVPDSQIRQWLKRCIWRRSKKITRKEKGKEMTNMDPLESFSGREQSVREMFFNDPQRTIVQEAVENLPPLERDCVRMIYFEQASVKEIATARGVSENEVSNKLKTARRRLRESLSRRGIPVTLNGLGLLLVCSTPYETFAAHQDRMLNAVPYLVQGRPVPTGILHPGLEAACMESVKPDQLVGISTKAKVALGLGLLSIPVIVGWSFREREQATAVANTVVAVSPADPDVTPEPVVPARQVFFPENPVAGQIHAVTFPQIGTPIEFVWIPGETDANSGQWLMRTEVTQAVWKKVGLPIEGVADPLNPSDFRGDDLPVDSITPLDAIAFGERFSQLVGLPLRIPTAQEWQRAAAGENAKTMERLTTEELDKVAWYKTNGELRTHPVGSKQPHHYGLYDMYGNVFELVTAGPDQYEIRGGCWCYDETWCRPTQMSKYPQQPRQSGVGLRLTHQPLQPETP